MKLLLTIAGVKVYQDQKRKVTFTAGAMIDGDGDPLNVDNDPHWQAGTALNYQGKPINAQRVPYAVIPPELRDKALGVVMGCLVKLTNLKNGKSCAAVIADEGPPGKLGEISCEAARRLGIPASALNGGTHEKIVRYELLCGVPATVDGITYGLVKAPKRRAKK